ncbi:MAG: patatin-like phospholipase family protein [Rhodocyclaceae bacterium]|nr:patatin-like phospholipase family protein [Rhodocyclaceae bacterium]
MFSRKTAVSRARLSLALQGGGAHGAFTWGVLDALLEHGRFGFDGISGTSAGAMNAVVMAHGWIVGGRDGAREALDAFWTAIADTPPFELAVPNGSGNGVTLNPVMKFMLRLSSVFSPSELNPLDLNPLRDVIEAHVDFERLRRRCPLRLFIAATQVNTGKLRLFRNDEISLDALLASACLPTMHHTVEIDGEPYWDGGYVANPAVFPLFYECASRDVMLVLLNPLRHVSTPASADEIRMRALELSFSANFLREMRMFAHAREYAEAVPWWRRGRLERRLLAANFHLIEAGELLGRLAPETKLTPSRDFLRGLHDLGRQHALAWLEDKSAYLGSRSSVEIAGLFS